jgi:hypothetical protein
MIEWLSPCSMNSERCGRAFNRAQSESGLRIGATMTWLHTAAFGSNQRKPRVSGPCREMPSRGSAFEPIFQMMVVVLI